MRAQNLQSREWMSPRLCILAAMALSAASVLAQQPPAAGVASPQVPGATVPPPPGAEKQNPFHLELGGFYNALSRGFSDWRGMDLKIQYSSPRATPFLIVSSQTRDEGTQQNFGVGSYIIFNQRYYSIVGISHAPDQGVVLYPRTRLDATVLGNIAVVPGLVLSGGITEFYGANRTGGRILSIGSLYYRGRAIGSAAVRFNRDRRSGATSNSAQVGIQYGEQGRWWVGGSISTGTEAYEVVAAVPFDAQFEGIGASVFLQRWASPHHGFAVRYDFEHKYTAFVRNGLAVTYFVEF